MVDSIVLEVSHQHPQLRPGARTGVWCATKLATDAGGWRQINRAGHPMMWPIRGATRWRCWSCRGG